MAALGSRQDPHFNSPSTSLHLRFSFSLSESLCSSNWSLSLQRDHSPSPQAPPPPEVSLRYKIQRISSAPSQLCHHPADGILSVVRSKKSDRKMDSDKEVNLSGKNLTPFSIADILSGSSKASADSPPLAPPPSNPPASTIVAQPTYPWFLFNHPPCWPLMLPDPSSQSAGSNGGAATTNNGQADMSSALTTVSSSPEDLDRLSDDDELFDQDEDDDEGNSIVGSLMSSTDDGQQEDALDMRASHRQHRRRIRSRKNFVSHLLNDYRFSIYLTR